MKFEYTKADIEAVARDNNYTINNVEWADMDSVKNLASVFRSCRYCYLCLL